MFIVITPPWKSAVIERIRVNKYSFNNNGWSWNLGKKDTAVFFLCSTHKITMNKLNCLCWPAALDYSKRWTVVQGGYLQWVLVVLRTMVKKLGLQSLPPCPSSRKKATKLAIISKQSINIMDCLAAKIRHEIKLCAFLFPFPPHLPWRGGRGGAHLRQ